MDEAPVRTPYGVKPGADDQHERPETSRARRQLLRNRGMPWLTFFPFCHH
jgi:hypothetical protein